MSILVDDCDKWLLEEYNFHAGRYASAQKWTNGVPQTLYLHRLIMNPPDGYQVDHINGNGLDNRRENLRLCTQSQNNFNCDSARGKSKFKGVSWEPKTKKWSAYIQVNKKKRRLGMYASEEEAALAYNRAALEIAGEFAKLNEVRAA